MLSQQLILCWLAVAAPPDAASIVVEAARPGPAVAPDMYGIFFEEINHAVERASGGRQAPIGQPVRGRVETGRWYDVKVALEGTRIRCYLDGKLIHDLDTPPPSALYAVAGLSRAANDVLLKVVNVTGEARPTDVRIQGAGVVASSGAVTTLTSADPDDENSLSHPDRVAPVTRRLDGLGSRFRYTFPPYSLTLLRLKTQQER